MHLCLEGPGKLVRFGCKLLLMLTTSLLLLLGACGGGSGAKILYALGLGTAHVIQFSVSSSGALSNPIVAVSTGSAPVQMVIDPIGPYAYVVDSAGGVGTGGISQYVRKAGGSLVLATVTASNGTVQTVPPAPTGVNPVSLVLDSTGTLVFVANKGSDELSVYTLDPTTGVITPLGCVEGQSCTPTQFVGTGGGTAPDALATTGTTLFVAFSGTNQIAAYTFDSKGTLKTPPLTAGTHASPIAMQLDPTGKFLFVLEFTSTTTPGFVEVFSIGSSGPPTPAGAAVGTGTNPANLRLHPSGKFLYVTNLGSNDMSAFTVDGSGGLSASSGSPFAAGITPSGISIDASGTLMFVANLNVNTISVFTIDSSGGLKSVDGSPFPSIVNQPVSLTNLN